VTSSLGRGEVEFSEIKSQAGEKCRIKNPWPDRPVTLYRNGKPAADPSGALPEFETEKNEVIILAPKATPLSAIRRAV
jgi:hypothetical protein